jgi:hypothetical protein
MLTMLRSGKCHPLCSLDNSGPAPDLSNEFKSLGQLSRPSLMKPVGV